MVANSSVSVSVHLRDGETFGLEWIKAHDHVREDYYRLRFGDNCTVFLSKGQADYLTMIMREGGQ